MVVVKIINLFINAWPGLGWGREFLSSDVNSGFQCGSPKHRPSKNINDAGREETKESRLSESSNTSSRPAFKKDAAVQTERSGEDIENSSEPDFFDEPKYSLREGYTRRLIKEDICSPRNVGFGLR